MTFGRVLGDLGVGFGTSSTFWHSDANRTDSRALPDRLGLWSGDGVGACEAGSPFGGEHDVFGERTERLA